MKISITMPISLQSNAPAIRQRALKKARYVRKHPIAECAPHKLLDAVAECMRIDSDADLSHVLDLQASHLSKIATAKLHSDLLGYYVFMK